MIKAEELRLNVFINKKDISLIDGSVLEVDIPIKVDIYILGEILSGNKLKKYSPIPITEDILIKAGFEKVATFTVMNSYTFDIGRNRLLSIGNVGTPNEMMYIQELGENNPKEIIDLICIHNYDYDGKLYLHNLQNKVHSLTSTELNILL